jgi:hypothetical protein
MRPAPKHLDQSSCVSVVALVQYCNLYIYLDWLLGLRGSSRRSRVPVERLPTVTPQHSAPGSLLPSATSLIDQINSEAHVHSTPRSCINDASARCVGESGMPLAWRIHAAMRHCLAALAHAFRHPVPHHPIFAIVSQAPLCTRPASGHTPVRPRLRPLRGRLRWRRPAQPQCALPVPQPCWRCSRWRLWRRLTWPRLVAPAQPGAWRSQSGRYTGARRRGGRGGGWRCNVRPPAAAAHLERSTRARGGQLGESASGPLGGRLRWRRARAGGPGWRAAASGFLRG